MHVISKKPFVEAARNFPNSESALLNVYKILEKGYFSDPSSLKNIFSSLDNFKYRDKWWVIDISGNNLRLIALIDFKYQKVFVKHIVSHADYDKLCKKYAGEKK